MKNNENENSNGENLELNEKDSNFILNDPLSFESPGHYQKTKDKKFLTFFENLINEKNALIEELRSSLVECMKLKEKEETKYKEEILHLEEKLLFSEQKFHSISNCDNKLEIVKFYEDEILKQNKSHSEFMNIVLNPIEQFNFSSFPEKKVIDNLRTIINNLKNQNSELTDQIHKLKFLERQSKVYKSLIFRIGDRMEVNKKVYEDLLKKYTFVKEDMRKVENDKKALEINLVEMKKTHQTSIDENLNLIRNLKKTDINEGKDKQIKEIKGGEFIKVINQERILLNKLLEELKGMIEKMNSRCEGLDKSNKFYFTKCFGFIKEKLDLNHKEIKVLFEKFENHYLINSTIFTYIKEIRSKLRTSKTQKELYLIEDLAEKAVGLINAYS